MRSHSGLLAVSATVGFLVMALPAAAQQQMGGAMMGADKEYSASMEKMQKDMMAGMDPDPTKAWVKMMMPHHQGAIDMSKTVLKQTKDPKIKAMAEKVVKEQTKEIKELQDWLKKNGG